MTHHHILTIDLGTSGPKAAVVSTHGTLVGSARASVPMNFGPDGAAEQDAELVWQATLEATRRALAAAVEPSSIVGVVASAQYSSIVPVGADGTPVAPMITWMDQRSSPKRLKRLPGYPRFGDSPLALAQYLRVHGLAPLESGMSLNHMRWFRYAASGSVRADRVIPRTSRLRDRPVDGPHHGEPVLLVHANAGGQPQRAQHRLASRPNGGVDD